MEPRRFLLEVFQAALAAVHGRTCVREHLRSAPMTRPVHLIAIGKAATAMAAGAHETLGAAIASAMVVTKHGYAEPLPWPVIEAGHPVPDAASLAAGSTLLRFVDGLPRDAHVLVLVSGGASALVEALPAGATLDDLRSLNQWLLGSGRDIVACNRIRKRLSLIKGGRLAARLAPRRVQCLAISDVPGDDPRFIGSGPLTLDASAATEPIGDAPPRVRALLTAAAPPPTDATDFAHVRYTIVARLADAIQAAGAAAQQRGVPAYLSPAPLRGEACEAGAAIAAELLKSREPGVFVWGGETTVTLPSVPGRGGRNQTLALAAARAMAGEPNVYLLAAGTDGSDGPTDDAGALVDGDTLNRGAAAGLDAAASLARADAGVYLEASGDLIQTGPTGTNVTDIVLGLRC